MNKSTAIRTGIAASVAGAGLAVAGISLASAADESASPDSGATSSESTERTPRGDHGRFGGPGRPRGGAMGPMGGSTELAEALGVSEEELREALESIREELAPAGPDAGTEPEAGEKPGSGDERPSPPSEADRAERQGRLVTALAEALDLSEDDVTAALEQVRSDQTAQQRESLAERLDQAVTDGDLTEADKASVLKAYDAGVLGGGPAGPGFGGGR